MNYIYDITLNFSKELYNFYEWDVEDNIEFYLKIPVFKVEKDVIDDFIYNKIIIDKSILNKIENKSEIYGKNSNKYASVFTSCEKVVAITFNEKGESIYKSFLCIDEENEVLEYSKLIKYSLINYKTVEKSSYKEKFLTRNENNTKNTLLIQIKNIFNNKEYDKLKYIFYEVYNEKNDDENKVYNKLINLIENGSIKINKIDLILKNINNKIKTS